MTTPDILRRWPARAQDLRVWPHGVAWFRGRRFPCAVGRGGVVWAKREGDGAGQAGVFTLERAYYRPDRIDPPIGALPTAPIRFWRGWSDDPDDPDYNRLVSLPRRWRHERLYRSDGLYDLVAVIDVNRRPPIAGCGSALFLHVWRRPRHPTAGCIAFERGALQWIVTHWTPRSRLALYPSDGTRAPNTAEPTRTEVAPNEIASS